MRAVLLVLDAMPPRHVNPTVTPVLAGLAAEGGWAREGGRAVLTSATYPNHATFVTGCEPAVHGLWANHVVRHGKVVRAQAVGPSVPTLFDACRDGGLRAVAVFGDHNLVGVMGARAAAEHWPVDGVMPEGRRLDDLGYLHDSGTIADLCAAASGEFDLLVAQLNEPDTASHVHGPDSDEAIAVFSETDGYLGELVEALRPRWDETVLAIVSDHDQETVTVEEPVDLHAAAASAGVDVIPVLEGNGAVVVGDDPLDGTWLSEVAGVEASMELGPGLRFVSAERGHWFAPAGTKLPLKGLHGGLGTRSQVAVVAGGHPAVEPIAATLHRRTPNAEDWAVTFADLLGVRLPQAMGRSLSR
jgi:Type I phosphodiesterase / nucleotide pyrophosphatase